MKQITSHLSAAVFAGALSLFAMSCNDDANSAKTDADTTAMGTQDSRDTANNRNETVMANNDMEDDASFCTKAAAANLAEVAAHKSAMARATSPEVKNAAKSMLADHEKMGKAMMTYAKAKNITLPTEPDNDKKAELAQLEQKTGADYDKGYIDAQVKDHNNVVDMFEKNNQKRTDPELNKMIADNLPTLRMHRDMVKQMQDKMK